jgi:hypothetical protein
MKAFGLSLASMGRHYCLSGLLNSALGFVNYFLCGQCSKAELKELFELIAVSVIEKGAEVLWFPK